MELKQLNQTINENLSFFQQQLASVIQIPSIKGTAQANAPFGKQPRAALAAVLKIAQEYGLKTNQLADQVGWAELPGKSSNYIAALGHLDVVAAPLTGWQSDPFKLTLKGDYMYGRGVLDNKGPIMGALFALALLKKENYQPQESIRVIFGTDEESGSADLRTYNSVEQPPIAGFTPDGKYPVVYAERGMVRLSLLIKIQDQSASDIAAIDGEFSPSYLPDRVQLKFVSGQIQTYSGIKTPSNAPDLGGKCLAALAQAQRGRTGEIGKAFKWMTAATTDTTGSQIGIGYVGKASGKLQISVYGAAYLASTQQLRVDFSIRYPIELTREQLLQNLTKGLPKNSLLLINKVVAPLYRDPQLPMIQKMRSIYESVTGLDGTPVTTTGITYARSLPNIVAFGPSFPGQRGIAHKENEWLRISDWKKIIAIEYLTLKSLAESDSN
ncbi:MAG: M20/M25/M40 family metallo-hydrolase [Liquorilactobacillus nagelii]|jgi:succinyl-diaminopimelate desuccinylase|uniref:M20/M25/M40 family metallo-hydrolase n=1 Tax=Liquorilactobacillus nagelii TaxID=82688 RepID=UPI00242DC15A|nr:M20/M25/M40 family metallo-hydrolase [Liquorilactobacillus nagelii]MCI1632707.1 M20/M25/M40 family metallo-hydrolase [Liquorilactobacillus nagelii]